MLPSSQGRERRRWPRFDGLPLLANIGGRLVRVMEISAGGMALEPGFKLDEGAMRFTLYPVRGGRVDLNRGFGGTARVVRRGRESVGVRFESGGYRLVKFVAACSEGVDDRRGRP